MIDTKTRIEELDRPDFYRYLNVVNFDPHYQELHCFELTLIQPLVCFGLDPGHRPTPPLPAAL